MQIETQYQDMKNENLKGLVLMSKIGTGGNELMEDMKAKRIEKILSEIELVRRTEIQKLPAKYIECGYKTDNILPPVTDDWKNFDENTIIGGYDNHCWIYTEFKTPKSTGEHSRILLKLLSGYSVQFKSCQNPQCIMYINGELIQGLDLNHDEYILKPETEYKIYLYYYSGTYSEKYTMKISLVRSDDRTEKLYYDFKVPYDAAMLFGDEDYNHIETIKHLNIAANYLDFTEPLGERFFNGAARACEYLKDNYYGKYAPHEATVDCIGHTHIDVAWLWTYAQTKEKAQRSFSIVVELMKRYPEYRFTISQPQLLEYLKEEAPTVYADIKELVKQGRIDIEGAMWVEPDCNLPSGESLVRQIIWGKKFIKDEFDMDSKILWLPDVFGYSVAIPQILKKSGVDKFVTSKIGWNEFNQIPYDLFKWVGVDGTEVSTYFMTCRDKAWDNLRATTYVGEITPAYIWGTWDRQQQKEYTDEVFMTYGYGDGGGGPTEEMLEMQRRLHQGVLGIPKTEMMTTTESLNRIESKFEKSIEEIGKTPKWKGELYLEFHRGTYTSVGKIKRYNRKTEFMLHNAEVLSVLNMLKHTGEYDKKTIDKTWKTVLLNQFHDVLPGSSIYPVYDDAFAMYETAQKDIKAVISDKIDELAQNIKGENKTVVFNPNGFEMTDVIKFGDKYITAENIPSMGWCVIDNTDEICTVKVENKAIENKFYKVVFDDDFDIISIYDKRNNREVIKSGQKANELIMYEDLPYSYDAWELSVYHKDKKYKIDEVVSYKPIFEGARAGFEIVKRFRNSTITQKIYLYNELDRIDFDTVVDWHLRHIIVKAAFPVDVNTNKATYEIQFGNIERNHTENTSWDVAKFETCAHKWADISDNGYGMALMNDCKYGHSVVDDSTLQLSLLRCGNNFDEKPNDQGEHIMSYSIIPHSGNYIDADIVRKAYAFNNPMLAKEINNSDGELAQSFSLIKTENKNIIIDTVKKAEDSENIIIRIYESQNIKDKIKLSFGIDIKKLYLCDLLENIEKEIEVKDNTAVLDVNNFEIITLMAEVK